MEIYAPLFLREEERKRRRKCKRWKEGGQCRDESDLLGRRRRKIEREHPRMDRSLRWDDGTL